jgi:hypothetical protein
LFFQTVIEQLSQKNGKENQKENQKGNQWREQSDSLVIGRAHVHKKRDKGEIKNDRGL